MQAKLKKGQTRWHKKENEIQKRRNTQPIIN